MASITPVLDFHQNVPLRLTEGWYVAQRRTIGGQQRHFRTRTKILQALTQPQYRQRAIEPAGIDNRPGWG